MLTYLAETIALSTALAAMCGGGVWLTAFTIGVIRIWRRNHGA